MSAIITFTGRELTGMGKAIPTNCVVRNERNGYRHADEIVRTMGQTTPHGIPYQPRQFPPGRWEITRVADCAADGEDAAYWPVWIDTSAVQELLEWKLKDGLYYRATSRAFIGRGYGIHHARYSKAGLMVRSNTTLGCLNVLDPDDMFRLAMEIREAMSMQQGVFVDVPDWEDWRE